MIQDNFNLYRDIFNKIIISKNQEEFNEWVRESYGNSSLISLTFDDFVFYLLSRLRLAQHLGNLTELSAIFTMLKDIALSGDDEILKQLAQDLPFKEQGIISWYILGEQKRVMIDFLCETFGLNFDQMFFLFDYIEMSENRDDAVEEKKIQDLILENRQQITPGLRHCCQAFYKLFDIVNQVIPFPGASDDFSGLLSIGLDQFCELFYKLAFRIRKLAPELPQALPTSVAILEVSLEASRKLNDTEFENIIREELVFGRWLLNGALETVTDIQTLIEYYLKTGEIEDAVDTLLQLTQSFQNEGNWKEAVYSLNQAEDLAKNSEYTTKLIQIYNLKTIYSSADLTKAEEYANLALSLAENTGDVEGKAVALSLLVDINGRRGRFDKAKDLFSQVQGLIGQLDDDNILKGFLTLYPVSFESYQNQSWLDTTNLISLSKNDAPIEAGFGFFFSSFIMQDFNSAVKQGTKLLDLIERDYPKLDRISVVILYLLTFAFEVLDNTAEALKCGYKASLIAGKTDNVEVKLIGYLTLYMSTSVISTNNQSRYKDYLLALAMKCSNLSLRLQAYFIIGSIELDINVLKAASELAGKVNNKVLGLMINLLLAGAHSFEGDKEQAKLYLKAAESAYSAASFQLFKQNILLVKSIIYRNLDMDEDALQLLRHAITNSDPLRINTFKQAEIMYQLFINFANREENSQAYEYGNSAVRYAEEVGNFLEAAKFSRRVALHFLDQAFLKDPSAEEGLFRAFTTPLAKEYGRKAFHAFLNSLRLAEVHRLTYPHADEDLREYYNYSGRSANEFGDESREQLNKYINKNNIWKQHIFEWAIELALRLGYKKAALALVSYRKARNLHEGILIGQNQNGDFQFKAPETVKENYVKLQVAYQQARFDWNSMVKSASSDETKLKKFRHAESALHHFILHDIAPHDPGYAASFLFLGGETEPERLHILLEARVIEAAAKLDEKSALVEQHLMENRVFTFVLLATSDKSPHIEVFATEKGGAEEATELVRDWIEAEEEAEIASSDFFAQTTMLFKVFLLQAFKTSQMNLDKTLERVLNQLGQKIYNPVINFLLRQQVEKVLLVPSQILQVMPLHLLPLSKSEQYLTHRRVCWNRNDNLAPHAEYFAEAFELTIAPSFLIWKHKRELPHEFQYSFRILAMGGDPTSSLHWVEPEVLETIHIYKEAAEKNGGKAFPLNNSAEFSDVKVLIGDQVNRHNLLENAPLSYEVHLSMHGEGSHNDEETGGLILFKPEEYQLRNEPGTDKFGYKDFLGQEWKTVHLVATSCKLAKSSLSSSDDYLGVYYGIMNSGVTSIISPLWAIDDMASLLISVRFHENIIKGLSRSSALAEASYWLRYMNNQEALDWLSDARLQRWSENMSDFFEINSDSDGSKFDSLRQWRDGYFSEDPKDRPFQKITKWGALFVVGQGW